MGSPVRVRRIEPDGSVAEVTLDRPDVRNAFDGELVEALAQAFGDLSDEPPERLRAVVLRGEGPAFCSGADIGWMQRSGALDAEANVADATRMAAMFGVIDRVPVPLITRVHGAALGGGMGLCAVSDVLIAEAATRMGFTETRLGIIPAVIAPFVIAKVGEGQARATFLGGQRFDARRAMTMGLVHQICDGEVELDAAIDDQVRGVLASGPIATRAAKALIRELRGASTQVASQLTAQRIASIRASGEAQEGLRAFTERRGAAWVPVDPDPGP